MPVKLSGFRIGRIQKIALDDQAKVIVRMKIDRKYSKWIRADSVATLRQEGLVGDRIIDVSVGSPDRPVLADDAFLPFQEEETLTDIALEMSESVKNVLAEVRKTIAYINDPQGDIKRTLANVAAADGRLRGDPAQRGHPRPRRGRRRPAGRRPSSTTCPPWPTTWAGGCLPCSTT